MGFKLSDSARKYFRKIETQSTTGKFPHLWDKYYLCFMVGALEETLGNEPEGDEFISEFISEYHDQRYEILGMLVSAEINRTSIPWDDEDKIREIMLDLLNPANTNLLTQDGERLMNKYAQGGYEVMAEEIPEPRQLDDFLQEYHRRYIDGSR